MRQFVAAFLLLLAAAEANGDFYRYVDEDGVESFTNTPTDSKAVRVLREAREKKAARLSSGSAASASAVLLPVQGNITSNYGWRHDPIDGGLRHHKGVDIAVPSGTAVKAIAAGKVLFSGTRGGYGNLVMLEHSDGSTSLYGHNSQLLARAGDPVEAGQTVALSGATGRCTGPHLHFELWNGGVNTTQAYLAGGSDLPEPAGSIRSYVHADGSLVFTNMH